MRSPCLRTSSAICRRLRASGPLRAKLTRARSLTAPARPGRRQSSGAIVVKRCEAKSWATGLRPPTATSPEVSSPRSRVSRQYRFFGYRNASCLGFTPLETPRQRRRVMRNTHGYLPFRAVVRRCFGRYYSGMKPQPRPNIAARQEAAPFYNSIRPAAAERTSRPDSRPHPPPARHARYPALSDDDQPPLISTRTLALLALVALILAMAVGL